MTETLNEYVIEIALTGTFRFRSTSPEAAEDWLIESLRHSVEIGIDDAWTYVCGDLVPIAAPRIVEQNGTPVEHDVVICGQQTHTSSHVATSAVRHAELGQPALKVVDWRTMLEGCAPFFAQDVHEYGCDAPNIQGWLVELPNGIDAWFTSAAAA